MKFITSVLLLFTVFFLSACKQESEPTSAPAATESAAPQAPVEESAPATAEGPAEARSLSDVADRASQTVGDTSTIEIPAAQKASIKEVSGFSNTITNTWDSMKGLDYADKALFVKKAMDMVSDARSKISMLQTVSSALPGGAQTQLLRQVTGMTGITGNLGDLLGKADSITPGGWSSYKDEVGAAMGLLGGQFSGLNSLF